ncbi:MAG: phosphoribosylaminoimidazolesuccinocarboxamide synthase, partial [Alphaproteobacteria bacterium]|nr:phosphoribosylaminoimidazolesuccinocarboxamide synthase [Alphaproteobacteria bacterium]
SEVYLQAFERITGRPLELPAAGEPILERIRRNLEPYANV